MAEINVKKKRNNSPNWPWILLILLAVGIVGWLLIDTGDTDGDLAYIQESEETTDRYITPDDRTVENNQDQTARDLLDDEETDRQAGQGNKEQIQSFVSFVEENNENIGREHNYSSQALSELADALSSLTEDANLQRDPDLQNLKSQADQLQQNPSSDQHANIMSDAFTSAANVIDKVQKQNYPDLDKESNEVKEAAQAMEPTELATNQEDKIKSFFDESADALQQMSR